VRLSEGDEMMAQFNIDEVCSATGGILRQGENRCFKGITTDTRAIRPDDLFVALKGEHFDGHDFIGKAVEKGAAGVLASREGTKVPGSKTALIMVDDTLRAFQQLARFHRQRFALPVIAVTGSNGKTTTKDMIFAALSSCYAVLKTEANYNNEIGLPLTLLQLQQGHEAAVVEMGMRGRGQITELAAIALPNVGVVTNVGETHMELLGSIENIAAAKAELVAAIPREGFVVLNADNEYVRAMGEKAAARTLFFGINAPDCDVKADHIRGEGAGTKFSVGYSGQHTEIFVPVPGRHNVYNALAAIAVGLGLGLSIDNIKAGLAGFTATGMRSAVVKTADYTIVNDAYNASPASMAAAIDTLSQLAGGRRVAVLGDMLELGRIAVEAHRRIGRTLADRGVEVVITVGSLARHIAEAAHEYGVGIAIACHNHDEASRVLKERLRPGDTVLIKGSRGMKMELLLKTLG
jgi:UDP-N-acetylmuramoyl-tripeptide--D-alanyl-D-alanine ligase